MMAISSNVDVINVDKSVLSSRCLTSSSDDASISRPSSRACHRRNLSLDFRSMGIVLPPPPVQLLSAQRKHCRNLSLDSVLQAVPELESAEDLTHLKSTIVPVHSSVMCLRDPVHSHADHLPLRVADCSSCTGDTCVDVTSIGSTDSGICSCAGEVTVAAATAVSEVTTDSVTSHADDRAEVTTDFVTSHADDRAEVTTDAVSSHAAQSGSTDSVSHHSVTVSRAETAAPCASATPSHTTSAGGSSWLLRLLQSDLFDAAMAIRYLFSSNEAGVHSYIANRLFDLPSGDVDFHLPQLIGLFCSRPRLSHVLRLYFLHRGRNNLAFSMRLSWLLSAYTSDVHVTYKQRSLAFSLNLRQLADTSCRSPEVSDTTGTVPAVSAQHHRSCSDFRVSLSSARCHIQCDAATSFPPHSPSHHQRNYSSVDTNLAALTAVRSGADCTCTNHTTTTSICPSAWDQQQHFVDTLVQISHYLSACARADTQQAGDTSSCSSTPQLRRSIQLAQQLNVLNLSLATTSLPHLWLPLYDDQPHRVVRIPAHCASLLASKQRAPYIVYVEIVAMESWTPEASRAPMSLSPDCCHQYDAGISQVAMTTDTGSDTDTGGRDGVTCERTCEQLVSANDVRARLSAKSSRAVCAETVAPPVDGFGTTIASSHSDGASRSDVAERAADTDCWAGLERWSVREARLRSESPHGHLPGWCLRAMIVKCGDDLRQEHLASQFLSTLQSVWTTEHVSLRVCPYRIVVLSDQSGLIEPVRDACSLHHIKQYMHRHSIQSLLDYFVSQFGDVTCEGFMRARHNFVCTCAGYCVASYLLQLKDRHNGNILLDALGNMVHVDYDYILSATPRDIGFERAQFKLTPEFVHVMGGVESDMFAYFRLLMLQGMLAARKHCDRLLDIVRVTGESAPTLPCMRASPELTVEALRGRLHLGLTEERLSRLVHDMVAGCVDSRTTRLYDGFQYYTNGIYS